jgi:hypothetical protein
MPAPVIVFLAAVAAVAVGMALRPRLGQRLPAQLVAIVFVVSAIAVAFTGAFGVMAVLLAAGALLSVRAFRA